MVLEDDELRFYVDKTVVVKGLLPLKTEAVGGPSDTRSGWRHITLTQVIGEQKKIRVYVDGDLVGEAEGGLAGEQDQVYGMSVGYAVALDRAGKMPHLDGQVMDMLFQKGKSTVNAEVRIHREIELGEDEEEGETDVQTMELPHIYLRWNIPGIETYTVQQHDHFVYEVFWEGTENIGVAIDIATQEA